MSFKKEALHKSLSAPDRTRSDSEFRSYVSVRKRRYLTICFSNFRMKPYLMCSVKAELESDEFVEELDWEVGGTEQITCVQHLICKNNHVKFGYLKR